MMSNLGYCIFSEIKMQPVSVFPHFYSKYTAKRSVDEHVQAKYAKYSNFRIMKTIAYCCVPTKFCTVLKTIKFSMWVMPKYAHKCKMANGRHLENTKNAISLSEQPFDWFWWNLVWWCTLALQAEKLPEINMADGFWGPICITYRNSIKIGQTIVEMSCLTLLARDVIYTSRAYAMMPVRLSVCLWRKCIGAL